MHLAAKLDIQRQIFKINQWRRFCNSLKSEKKVHIIFLRMLICFSNLVFDLINNFKKSRMWWSVFNFGKIPKKIVHLVFFGILVKKILTLILILQKY